MTSNANRDNSDKPRRQYVRYWFLKIDAAWRALPADVQEAHKQAFEAAVTPFAGKMLIRAYSTVGTRGDVDILLWQVSRQMELFQDVATAAFSTPLGPYLSTPYAFLAMTKRSIYDIPEAFESDTNKQLTILPGTDKYLFIYPFVKTRAWYALPFEERQAMISHHITVGRKYPSVKLNTTYSFGLDDQEFVVAFETSEAGDFLDLVMDLRETQASVYTLRDTPIFTCIATSLRGALDALGTNVGMAQAVGSRTLIGPTVGASSSQSLPIATRDLGSNGMAGSSNGHDSGNGQDALHVPMTSPDQQGLPGAGGWAPVLVLDELPPDGRELVYAHNDQIAVFQVDDSFYAISNRCSHARGDLVSGELDGCVIACPSHGGRFDLRTGWAIGEPAQVAVPAYEVRVREGRLEVRPQRLIATGESHADDSAAVAVTPTSTA